MDGDDRNRDSGAREGEWLPHIPSGSLSRTDLRRADVVSAFHMAFQMIGGVPRLALWADMNPTEFYKLYARLLPSQASDELNSAQRTEIIHSLPPPNYSPFAQRASVAQNDGALPDDDK